MAASPHCPIDAHNDTHHLEHHYARFPSLSQFPDSPSVYSHAYQSPDADTHPHTPSLSFPVDPTRCLADDATASTMCSVQDDSDLEDSTDDASHRISLRGPKIRFHSRAPWETDGVISHGENPESNPRPTTFGSKLRGKASKADTLIRTLARGSSTTNRPSVDSVRSQASATSSFEITAGNYMSSRGALYNLATESMSTSSLASSATSASAHQPTLARTTNLLRPSHSFTQTCASLSRTTFSVDGMAPPSTTLDGAPVISSSSDAPCVGREHGAMASSSEERQSHDEFVHPYANPDLVSSYTPSPEAIPTHNPILGNESDSNSTVADSTSVRSAVFSVASAETSMSQASRDPSCGNPRVNGKEISSPISVLHPSDSGYVDRNTRFLSLHPPPPGFDGSHRGNPRSPTVTLITLQEAQAKERIRGSTVHTTIDRPKMPFPNANNMSEAQTEEPHAAVRMTRMRAQSTSAGTQHRSIPLSPTRVGEGFIVSAAASPAPGRTLKHKKSGFMRLFIGRNSEGEKEKASLPPILPPAEVYAKQSLDIQRIGKTPKPGLSKVPRPSFQASGASYATSALTNSGSSGGDGLNGKSTPPRRRQPPSLSIVTQASDRSISSSVTGRSSSPVLNYTPPPSLPRTVPQSAPPGDTDFPGLKLRPVSTSFSSHFADMVAPTVEELQREVYTPSSAASSTTALSPFTPVSMRRSDGAPATGIEAPGEEYLTVRGLQGQFISAKKAWQQQIWELRGQIRDLTSELEALRAAENQEYCEACGRGKPRHHASPPDEQLPKKVGVINRPRARTGDTARFASGN